MNFNNTRLAVGLAGLGLLQSRCYTGPTPESLEVLPGQDAGRYDARTAQERASVCLGIGDDSRTSLGRVGRLKIQVTPARGSEAGCVNYDIDQFTIVPPEASDAGSANQIRWTGRLRPAFVESRSASGVPVDGGTIGGSVAQPLALQNRYTIDVSGTLVYSGTSCRWNMTLDLPSAALPVVVGSDNCTTTTAANITTIPSPTTLTLSHRPPSGSNTVTGSATLCAPGIPTTCSGNSSRTITATLSNQSQS